MSELLTAKGRTSSMRVAMLACVFVAGYLAIVGLHLRANLFEVAPLCLLFLGAGITGKVYQKGIENVQGKNAENLILPK